MGVRAGDANTLISLRARLRDVVARTGGVITPGAPLTGPLPHVDEPFGRAEYLEDAGHIIARPVSESGTFPSVAFVDGIQRYAVEARFGVVPVIRGHAAAAVMHRQDGRLQVEDTAVEDFLVVPQAALTRDQLDALASLGLPMHDVEPANRAHPVLDLQRAAQMVERRRESLETRLAIVAAGRDPTRWLVLDGSVRPVLPDPPSDRVVGIVKSHETQFLLGHDLEAALTLREGCRTSVFRRHAGSHGLLPTWYLRVWPWEGEDLLHGLIRVERVPSAPVVSEADLVSGWLLAERTPIAAPDARWDRLLYPIHQVETYLRAQLGGWW